MVRGGKEVAKRWQRGGKGGKEVESKNGKNMAYMAKYGKNMTIVKK